MTDWGSGTIVDRRAGRAYVLTCWHIFRDGRGRGQAIIRMYDGRTAMANVLKVDQQNDLAVLEIVDPNIKPLKVAEAAPVIGEQLWAAGCGQGTFRMTRGQVRRYARVAGQQANETLNMTGAARQGDSGGPIVNQQGQVVAVLWGTDGQRITGTYCLRVRRFLAWLFRRPVVVAKVPAVLVPVKPAVPPKPAVPDKPVNPSTPSATDLAKLQARIAKLEKQLAGMKPVAGPRGPMGPQGLLGPIGPQGKPGVCDAKQLPPITVQTVKNGKVIETEEVYLGGILSFNLVPVGGSK